MNRFVAGLVSSLPLSLIALIVMLIWGRQIIAAMQSGEAEPGMSDRQLYWLILAGMVLYPFVFGLISALVYGWAGSPVRFRQIAIGLALVMTIAAVVSRTPFMAPKIIANLAVAGVYGWMLPALSG